MSKLPTVVIVGRANVGKSTLFNRLSVEVKSLILDYAGVTRDIIKDTVCWKDRCFELVDTGGVSLKKVDDPIIEQVRLRVLTLLKEAELIIFVCDGTVGLLQEDRDIAKLLYKLGKPVILVVNKVDYRIAQENIYDFQKLGFEHVVPVSAQHGTGISALLDVIIEYQFPQKKVSEDESKARYNVVLLGKPNVGKSSLMNLLLKKERAIVTEIPGTTREALKENVRFYQESIQVTDTPGIRRKRAVTEPLEGLMVKSSLQALKEADIVLLLVDASEGKLSDQELKLAFYAFNELHKALILLFNKQDLVTDDIRSALHYNFEAYRYFLDKIERLDISCKTGANVGKIFPLVQKVWQRYSQTFSSTDLTMLLKDALHKRPLYHKTNILKLFSARQLKAAPITLLLIVNQPRWFGPSQQAFLENVLRKEYDLRSVPIKFIMRTS